MSKEDIKQKAKEIKAKAEEIEKECEDEEILVPPKKKHGRANGDPMVILYD